MTAPGPEEQARRRRARRGRSYVTLVVICVGAAFVSVLYNAHLNDRVTDQQKQLQAQQQEMRRDLCGVIGPFASTPVRKEGPGHPANAAAYEWHQKFAVLSGQFHC